MSPGEIMIFGRAFKLGMAAEREKTRALVAQADSIAAELAVLKAEVAKLEASTALVEAQPGPPVLH